MSTQKASLLITASIQSDEKNNTTRNKTENETYERSLFKQYTDGPIDEIKPIKQNKRPFLNKDFMLWEHAYKVHFQSKIGKFESQSCHITKPNDPLLKETPFPIINKLDQPYIKEKFVQFLDGRLSSTNLVEQVNHQHFLLAQKVIKIERKRFQQKKISRRTILPNSIILLNQQSNQAKSETQSKLKTQQNIQKIRDAILQRIHAKNEDTDRSENLVHLGLFKQMYDATDNWLHKIENRKCPVENERIIQRHKTMNIVIERPSECYGKGQDIEREASVTKPARIKFIKENIQRVLEDERKRKQTIKLNLQNRQQEDLEIQKNLKIKIKANLTTQQDQELKEYEILISKYLHSYLLGYKKDRIPNTHRVTFTNLDKEDEIKIRKQKAKTIHLNKLAQSKLDTLHNNDSGDSSLISAYEVNMNDLYLLSSLKFQRYEESLFLQDKLTHQRIKEGFGKKIKNIQRLQQLESVIQNFSASRLGGTKQNDKFSILRKTK